MSLLPDVSNSTFSRQWQKRGASKIPDPRSSLLSLSAHDSDLVIDCPSPTLEDAACAKYHARGQFLARQDRWADLAQDMRDAERTSAKTPDCQPVATLLSSGARSDVVMAIQHALYDGHPARDAPLLAGIEAFEFMLQEARNDMMLAIVVAHTHIDMARAWRGTGAVGTTRQRNHDAFEAHLDRARDILDLFPLSEYPSPTLAAAKCALKAAGPDARNAVITGYETLIDLDPSNPDSLRALGHFLTQQGAENRSNIERQADRMATRTHDTWGAGAYVWVTMDALSGDDCITGTLDTDLFITGLQDILAHDATQHRVNFLAAFCAITIGNKCTDPAGAHQTFTRIKACANWIVRNHMTELHPKIWARAATGFDDNPTPQSARGFAATGKTAALRRIKEIFAQEIKTGHRIVFTPHGPVAEPA